MPSTIESILGWTYLLLGPVVWGLFLFVMVKGRKRMQLLSRPIFPLPNPAPKCSVLIPVKDEEAKIESCLRTVLAQKYPDIEFILIDDRSTDRTGVILDQLAERDSRLRVLHIEQGKLPDGWIGKSHALHVGMQHATGDWLLFVDSDVVLAPDALSATIACAEKREFGMISLLPKLICNSFWEKLIVPLGGIATNAMYSLPLTNSPEWPEIAFANGQYMCLRRSAYDAIGGHAAHRSALSEDIAIARAMKKKGLRPRISTGQEFASTRMYDSFGSVFRGWARNFFCGTAGHPWKIILAIAVVLICCASAYVALGWGIWRHVRPADALAGWGWITAALVHLGLMTVALGISYFWTGNSWLLALLLPLGAALLIAIMCRTLWICATGRVVWRDTQYIHRAGQGVTGTAAD